MRERRVRYEKDNAKVCGSLSRKGLAFGKMAGISRSDRSKPWVFGGIVCKKYYHSDADKGKCALDDVSAASGRNAC